jgi:hypothetical protein
MSKRLTHLHPMTRVGKFFTPPNFSVDEQRKRSFLALFLLTVCPVLMIFGLLNFLTKGVNMEALLIALAALLGILHIIALRYVKDVLPMFRIGVFGILSLLTFEIATGGGEGVVFLWFYFHPVATFFLFGAQEGLFWVLLSWIISLVFLVFNLGFYHYESASSIRFMVTYTLVCILSYGLESSRNQYYNLLLAEKVALEAALQQVKTLRGLLPICASCKKIRDDAGYWHGVESYISQHVAVEFSHSICPECRTKLYSPQAHDNLDKGPIADA